jgi:hypothetical protein
MIETVGTRREKSKIMQNWKGQQWIIFSLAQLFAERFVDDSLTARIL